LRQPPRRRPELPHPARPPTRPNGCRATAP
jgi:hypothetical protein